MTRLYVYVCISMCARPDVDSAGMLSNNQAKERQNCRKVRGVSCRRSDGIRQTAFDWSDGVRNLDPTFGSQRTLRGNTNLQI
eukprot:329207-Prorocentrum_minimum.AAC.3